MGLRTGPSSAGFFHWRYPYDSGLHLLPALGKTITPLDDCAAPQFSRQVKGRMELFDKFKRHRLDSFILLPQSGPRPYPVSVSVSPGRKPALLACCPPLNGPVWSHHHVLLAKRESHPTQIFTWAIIRAGDQIK